MDLWNLFCSNTYVGLNDHLMCSSVSVTLYSSDYSANASNNFNIDFMSFILISSYWLCFVKSKNCIIVTHLIFVVAIQIVYQCKLHGIMCQGSHKNLEVGASPSEMTRVHYWQSVQAIWNMSLTRHMRKL
jgi:hypothetical protein